MKTDSVKWLSNPPALFPDLLYLNLPQYSYAKIEEDLSIPDDAHPPFSKLKEVQLYGFHWYFDAIERGLGFSLTSLDFAYSSKLTPAQVISTARKLTSLKCLRFAGPLDWISYAFLSRLHRLPKAYIWSPSTTATQPTWPASTPSLQNYPPSRKFPCLYRRDVLRLLSLRSPLRPSKSSLSRLSISKETAL